MLSRSTIEKPNLSLFSLIGITWCDVSLVPYHMIKQLLVSVTKNGPIRDYACQMINIVWIESKLVTGLNDGEMGS